MWEKSENFNSLRPILFELCKKNYRGGGQIDPPPSRNRVNRKFLLSIFYLDDVTLSNTYKSSKLLTAVHLNFPPGSTFLVPV